MFSYVIAVLSLLLFTRRVFRNTERWASWLTGLCTILDPRLGVVERTSITTDWLAFFPPPFYRKWIVGGAANSSSHVVG